MSHPDCNAAPASSDKSPVVVHQTELVDTSGRVVDDEFLKSFPIGFARRHLILAFESDDPFVVDIVTVPGENRNQVVDIVGRVLRRDVRAVIANEEEILRAIATAYQDRSTETESLVGELSGETSDVEVLTSDFGDDLLDSASDAPVVSLVNSILFDGIRAGASDVHVQPEENSVVVRQRIDGVLFDVLTVPKDVQDEVLSRLKVLAKMNIAEKRMPQDGRASVRIGDRVVDLRIASLPTSYGERIVVRFLDKSARLYSLEELGMDEHTLGRFRGHIKQEHGLLLVTGPTGGGKSTTLYAALQEIDAKDLNVLTLEDPIEYKLDGISQTQINTKKGLTFAQGLRNVLRQDPDIIMVGEIRDEETAIMGIQAALTGHLVFSTLHTNDAPSAVTRLLDLGIEPFLVSSSVIGVVAQRLVRKICSECREPCEMSEAEVLSSGISEAHLGDRSFYRGAGCDNCRGTGYRGRIGIFELLEVRDSIRELIQNRANAAHIRRAANELGMKMLRDDGLDKARAGLTTIDEVVRVTMQED